MYKAFLIKYGEIGTKGKNRYIFEDMLVHQIRHALKKVEGTFDVTKENGRIYVEGTSEFDDEDAINALRKVFGILWICPMLQVKDEGFDKLAEDVIDYLRTMYRGKKMTFKVNARRARKNYPLDSMGINMAMGEKILEAMPEMTVDVHNPDIYVNIEIRSRINIYTELIPGPGGMPVGTNGKAMLLLSGGIDSPVAGYMVAKRGVKIDAVYFHAPPYTSERAKEKVIDLARIVTQYSGPINLHVVNFTDIQLYIYEKCPHDELTIIMRRYMMKIAEHFAKQGIPFREAHAIVGHMVKACEKKGCDLEDLTDEELQAIDKRVTKELLGDISIKSCVNARVSFGGTAPSEVHRQIEVGRQWLNSLER